MSSVVEDREITRTEGVLIDMTCDMCGISLASLDLDYNLANFNAYWQYGSKYDGESWDCDLCESCAEKVKAFIESTGGRVIVSL